MLPGDQGQGSQPRSGSIHGSKASSASRSSISPEEQQLADDLQTAGVILESQEKSTSSSTDSEARDSLKEREAKERSMEFIRRHCRTDARVSPQGSQGNSSGKGSGSRTPNTMQTRTSARVLGLARIQQGQGDPSEQQTKASSRSKESSSPSGTTSEKDANASSSSGGDHSRGMTMGELTDKIAKLEQSIQARDAEAATLLQNCEDIEEAGIIAMARVKEELAAAVAAKEQAEKQRNKLETAAAGDKARYDNNMAYEKEENAERDAKSHRQTEDLMEAALELIQARADLQKSRENASIDEAHALASSNISAERINELEKALAASTAQLAAALQRESGKQPAGSNAEIQRGLRNEINELEEERQETNKQMSGIRLELLGLKRDKERRRVETGQASSQPSSTTRPGRQRGQVNRKGKGRSLEIIDEEDDDLPETRSLDQADLASECVSSDHETDSAADATAQRDLVNKLLKQLGDQKKFMQELKAEHAGASAEQLEQIQQLMMEMSENSLLHETMAAEHEILKKKEKFNRLDHLKKMNLLQQTMRTMQGKLDDQDVKMKEQNRAAETFELNTTNLEEQLQLQTEALRITSLRLQDALQQHENDSVRNKQEQNSLRLQLAAEKRKMGDFSTCEEQGAEMSMEEIQDQRIKDLQEERNILIGRIELKDVQFQLQIEELHREYATKMQEQQRHFADQMAELRAAPGAFHQISSMPLGALGSSGPAGLVTGAVLPKSQPIHDKEVFSSSQAVSGVASSQSRSEGEGTGTDTSGSSQSPFTGLKGLIWNILCLLPNVAALLCSEEGAIIQNITQRVGVLLGSNLIGKSFYSLVKEKNLMSLQRTIMASTPVTDAHEYKAEDLSRTLARHQLEAPNSIPVDLLIAALHLPGSPGERHILILLVEQPSERARNQQSVASSDICPSDSVSVNRRRPQLMRTEVQRTKLRASFFSTRQSQRDASSSASSPRSSWLR